MAKGKRSFLECLPKKRSTLKCKHKQSKTKKMKNLKASLPVNLTDLQKVTASLHPVAADGSPAVVENISWVLTSGDVTLSPSADLLSCDITSGAIGNSTVSVSGTADNGSILTDIILVTVTGVTTAVDLGTTFGTPVNK